jgi:hypothetical protein
MAPSNKSYLIISSEYVNRLKIASSLNNCHQQTGVYIAKPSKPAYLLQEERQSLLYALAYKRTHPTPPIDSNIH